MSHSLPSNNPCSEPNQSSSCIDFYSFMGPFTNYVIILREEGGGLEKSLHTLTWGEGGQTHSYVIFFKSRFYSRNSAYLIIRKVKSHPVSLRMTCGQSFEVLSIF